MLNKLAATIVTGFLGSGKTTLLRHLLNHAQNKRIAVLVNEFGALGIDGDLLRCDTDCEQDAHSQTPVYELANGCICCTVQEEFFPVMKELVKRREQLDHILIETSGLALPKPLVQAFNWPEIKAHCTVNAVVTVVDAPAVAAGMFAADPDAVNGQRLADPNLDHDSSLHELFADQLSTADLVVVNKTDLLPQGQLHAVHRIITEEINPGVNCIDVAQGKIDPELVIGFDAAVEDGIHLRKNHHDSEDHDHDHDAFNSIAIQLAEIEADLLIQICKQLIAEFPILRLKGIAAVPDKPMRLIVQGVGQRMDHYFDRQWTEQDERRTKLIIIGSGIDENKIKIRLDQLISDHLHAPT